MPAMNSVLATFLLWAAAATTSAVSLERVDPLIGTEGSGSQYGGMMPSVCEPFGSFHLVPMTRLNRVGQLSFNSADKSLIGFILTRQPRHAERARTCQLAGEAR